MCCGRCAWGVEDEIVRLRKQPAEAGLDAGAETIHLHRRHRFEWKRTK